MLSAAPRSQQDRSLATPPPLAALRLSPRRAARAAWQSVGAADVARGCLAGGRECGALSPLVGRRSFLALRAAERAPSSAARRRRVRGDTGGTPPRRAPFAGARGGGSARVPEVVAGGSPKRRTANQPPNKQKQARLWRLWLITALKKRPRREFGERPQALRKQRRKARPAIRRSARWRANKQKQKKCGAFCKS